MLKSLIALRFRALMSSLVRGKNGQPATRGRKILYGFLFAYIIVVYGSLFAMMCLGVCEPLHDGGLASLYYAIAALLALGLGLIGSVFATQNQLYDATDNEFLLSMPIPPRTILLSRMLMLYLTNLLFTALVMLPALIIGMIFGHDGPMTLVWGLIGTLLLPLGSLTLSCILGALFAYISSKLPNKNIISLVFTLVFMFAYFYLINRTEALMSYIVEHTQTVALWVGRVGWRATQLGRAMAGEGALHMLYFTLAVVVPFAIVLFVLDRSFIGIATRQKGGRRRRYVKKPMKERGPLWALTCKELKHLGSSATWMLNGALGLLFTVVGPFSALRHAAFLENIVELAPLVGEYMPLVMALFMCATLTMTTISAAAVSMEGASWWLTRVMPVKTRDILLSKALMHMIVAAPFVLAGVIMTWLCGGMSFITALIVLLMPVTFVALTAIMGVIFNLRFYSLNWPSEAYAVKSGLNILLEMASSLLLLAAPVIVWVVWLTGVVSPIAMAGIMTVLYIAVTALLYRWLVTKGAAKYETIG